jgi:hypothetical protein
MSNSDLQLARTLLNGFVDEVRQRPETRYLVKGCAEEVEARRAIARLLRSNYPLDRQLREHLADLFDPDLRSSLSKFHRNSQVPQFGTGLLVPRR